MKRILCSVANIFVFELPFEITFIATNFSNQHLYYKAKFPNWSLAATKRKVIIRFWLQQVVLHFGLLFTTAICLLLAFTHHVYSMPGTFAGGIFALLVMTSVFYFPKFYGDFLPALETIIAGQEKQLAEQEELNKCKRTQFSTPTLTIIFFVFSKVGTFSLPPANETGAMLLNHLFGVDKDKLKQNLSRLYKTNNLSVKERAELIKGIAAARSFFDALGCKPAESILNQFEIKLHHT
jgi:hypothetical protein